MNNKVFWSTVQLRVFICEIFEVKTVVPIDKSKELGPGGVLEIY